MDSTLGTKNHSFTTRPIGTDELLIDWACVVRQLQRQPTRSEYRRHGKYHLSTLQRRFKDWNTLPDAFQIFLTSQPRYSDVLPYIRITPPVSAQIPTATHPHRALRTARRIRSRPACGLALDFGPLRHEPVNEQGVVFAFGMLAERLGFMVEAFQINFPDCQAKRRIPEGWQQVNIEFEYESKNFRLHRHPPQGCDLIVCWRHNWPECPKNLEVIALSDEIKRFTA